MLQKEIRFSANQIFTKSSVNTIVNTYHCFHLLTRMCISNLTKPLAKLVLKLCLDANRNLIMLSKYHILKLRTRKIYYLEEFLKAYTTRGLVSSTRNRNKLSSLKKRGELRFSRKGATILFVPPPVFRRTNEVLRKVQALYDFP